MRLQVSTKAGAGAAGAASCGLPGIYIPKDLFTKARPTEGRNKLLRTDPHGRNPSDPR